MKRIKVYEGFSGNVFITDKFMPRLYDLIGEFDNVPDAEDWCDDEYGYSPVVDSELVDESKYDLRGDDSAIYTFNYFDYV